METIVQQDGEDPEKPLSLPKPNGWPGSEGKGIAPSTRGG